MKVLLINPNSYFISSYFVLRHFLPPIAPLGLAYIASMLESLGITVRIIDMFADKMTNNEVLKIIKNINPDIVGFSVLTSVENEVRDLIKKIKEINKKITIILGNTHASIFAQEFLEENIADIVVRSEGEIPMIEICQHFNDKDSFSEIKGISYRLKEGIFHNSDYNGIEDLDILPLPAFHLLDLDKYRNFPLLSIYDSRFLPISASRGCTYSCYFCAQGAISKKFRYRNMKSVVDEIEYMHKKFKAIYFCFTDAFFPFSEITCFEFCEEILKRGLNKKIKWITETRVDKVNNKSLKMMKEAGLYLIMYGIEVGNQEVLDKIDKKTTLQQARDAIRYTKENGILSVGLYILGLPGETVNNYKETIRLSKELDCDISKFNIAIPYPGSRFFNEYMRYRKIKDPHQYTSLSWFNYINNNLSYPFNELNFLKLASIQRRAMIYFYCRPKIIFKLIYKKIINYRNLFYGIYWILTMVILEIFYKFYIKINN